MRKVDVVIPVYGGLEDTRQCVESAIATVDPSWARIVVINDASPEPEITRYLRDLAEHNAALVLLENEQNLGFTATANRGLQHDQQDRPLHQRHHERPVPQRHLLHRLHQERRLLHRDHALGVRQRRRQLRGMYLIPGLRAAQLLHRDL